MLSAPARFWSQSQFRSADHIAGNGGYRDADGYGGLGTEDWGLRMGTYANQRQANETCIFYGSTAVCSARLWAISKAQVPIRLRCCCCRRRSFNVEQLKLEFFVWRRHSQSRIVDPWYLVCAVVYELWPPLSA